MNEATARLKINRLPKVGTGACFQKGASPPMFSSRLGLRSNLRLGMDLGMTSIRPARSSLIVYSLMTGGPIHRSGGQEGLACLIPPRRNPQSSLLRGIKFRWQ